MPSLLPLRKSFREFRRRPGRNLLSILTISVAFSLLLSSTMVSGSMQATLDKQRRLTRYADIEVFLEKPAPEEVVNDVKTLDNIETAEPRVLVFAKILIEGSSELEGPIRIFGVPSPQTPLVNAIVMESGTYFANADELKAIESSLWGVTFSKFTLYTPYTSVNVDVIGTGTSPELNVGKALAMPNKTLQRLFFNGSVTNVIYIRLSNPSQIAPTASKVNEMLAPFGPDIQFTPRSYFWESFQTFFGQYIFVIGLVGLALGVLIVYVSVKSKVDRELYEIGVLKAVGARKTDVLAIFVSHGLLVVSCALVAGTLLGYFLLQQLVHLISGAAHVSGFEVVVLDPASILWLSGLTVAFTVLSVLTASYGAITSSPREALQRRHELKSFSRSGGKLPFKIRSVWRNLNRNRARYTLTGLIILLSTGSVLAMVNTLSATQQTLDIVGTGLPDIYIHFSYPKSVTNTTTQMRVNGVETVEPLAIGTIFLNEGFVSGIQGTVIASRTQDLKRLLENGRTIESDDEVMISSFLSSKINKDVGDTLVFSRESFANETFSLRIVGVYFFPFPHVTASFSFVQTAVLNGNPEYSTDYAAKVNDDTSVDQVVKLLTVPGSDAFVVDARYQLRDETSLYITPLSMLNYVVVILMLALSSVSILTMTTTSLLERRNEYAILKALGGTPLNIFGGVILETFFISASFAMLGMLLGYLLTNASLQAAQAVMSVPFSSWFSFEILPALIAFCSEVGAALFASIPPVWNIAWREIGSELRYE